MSDNAAKQLNAIQTYLARTLDCLDDWDGTWETEDVREMLTDALRLSGYQGIA